MKKFIIILFVLLSNLCHAQKHLDSTKVVYDKDGNIFKKEYYSSDKKICDTVNISVPLFVSVGYKRRK